METGKPFTLTCFSFKQGNVAAFPFLAPSRPPPVREEVGNLAIKFNLLTCQPVNLLTCQPYQLYQLYQLVN